MSKSNLWLYCLSILLILSVSVQAEQMSDRTDAEIRYLLNQIATTDCVFNRNGSRHQGDEAVAHIQRKYDYFKDDIASAEDFIDKSASRSTISRRAYTIECAGLESVESEQWLLQKLSDYRSEQ